MNLKPNDRWGPGGKKYEEEEDNEKEKEPPELVNGVTDTEHGAWNKQDGVENKSYEDTESKPPFTTKL